MKTKPSSITDLESRFNHSLEEMQDLDEILNPFEKKMLFAVNDNNDVIGLSLANSSIEDLSFLKNFPFLKCLNLQYSKFFSYTPIAGLKSLEMLDISGNKIIDISVLTKLSNLTYLNIYNNKINDIGPIKTHTKLECLLLGSNELEDASAVAAFTNLKFLNLDWKGINDLHILAGLTDLETLQIKGSDPYDSRMINIDLLPEFSHLKTLYMDGVKILNPYSLEKFETLEGLSLRDCPINDIRWVTKLPNLNYLNVCNTRIGDFSPLAHLINLKGLYLIGTAIASLDPLSKLEKLTDLRLNKTKITDFRLISNLTNLSTLYLGNCNLKTIEFLKDLTNLRTLHLNKNEIADISLLTEFTNLRQLDLSNNKISDITPLLPLLRKGIPILLKSWVTFDAEAVLIEGNPLDETMLALIKNGNEAIIRHFERIEAIGIDFIYEAKLTLVGEGSAGKTSLQIRLLNEKAPLPTEETRTRGIKINDWTFDLANKKFTTHIWDFGGQDVYYPVHRFFLTENSVFVLLASSRQKQHNFDYWIPTIFQFGGKSPIILGQTCHAGNKVPWNDIGHFVSNENFNIIKTGQLPYYELDLPANNYGLGEIRNVILDQIRNLPYSGMGVPKTWIPIRSEIAKGAAADACISFEKFVEICKRANPHTILSSIEIEDIASFLHSLGIVLWYSDHEELRNWVILQPEWAMNAVYRIIDDSRIQNQRGIILASDFTRLWHDKTYHNKHNILKNMLKVFKIAFPKKHSPTDYIIPARLMSIPDELIWPAKASNLRLEYHYEFMPKGIVNQLSADLSRLISSDMTVWNNAVILSDGSSQTKAQIMEDFYNRKIYVKAEGKDARGLVMIIINAMTDIIDGYKGLKANIIVPCSCEICQNSQTPTLFPYEKILKWGESRKIVTCNESGTSILIDNLLFMVGLRNSNSNPKEDIQINKPLKAFISYSKFDGESNKDGINFLEEFKKHLNPLCADNNLIETWDDTLLIPGDEWDNSIRDELNKSDVLFLLISKDFLNTNYIRNVELKIALERYNKGNCIIIPIILSACAWEDSELLKSFSGIPRKGHTIASWGRNKDWKNMDDAWNTVYKEVKKMITAFRQKLIRF